VYQGHSTALRLSERWFLPTDAGEHAEALIMTEIEPTTTEASNA
jgi:hypothetical protein